MKNIVMIPSEKTFVEWVSHEYAELNLTEKEASTILGYVFGHGCGLYIDESDTMVLLDLEEPENGILTRGFDELMEQISSWNYEFIEDDQTNEAHLEDVLVDAEVIDKIMERMGYRVGRPLGTPTVKELIAILSKFPEDYSVTCCGTDNFLYLFPQSKAITIDCERIIG